MSLETQIINNCSKLPAKIDAVNKNAKKALQFTKNNEIVISNLKHEH